MQAAGSSLILSATDLSNFLGCRHRTALEMAHARGLRQRPHWHDPLLEILFQRGLAHEKAYVESLRDEGLRIVDLTEVMDRSRAVARTHEAMQAGADAIVQAALADGAWYGRPDVLRRVDRPSALGAWSYEVTDTKLARETRAGAILQLGLYSEMLGVAQGAVPEFFHVVTPAPDVPRHTFRTGEYAAYLRWMRAQLGHTARRDHDELAAEHYPEPVEHCDICAWTAVCRNKRRVDDHLSLVAGISALQRRELESRDVATVAALARLPIPLAFKPRRGAAESYERVREQARVQWESREKTTPVHERRPFDVGEGLSRLPEPSPGDIFIDIEGDPFAAEGGREYLIGVLARGENGNADYRGFWALDERQERAAFEAVIDIVMRSWRAHEGMHVYHYAPYEPAAFKRLMGRYATREEPLDRLLRAGRFVDLYGVVRQGLRVGVERYSIKNLEPLYAYERRVPLAEASRSLRAMEHGLELKCPDAIPPEVRERVQGYNEDDCRSALALRQWLEDVRAQMIADGVVVPRPTPGQGEAPENVDERAERVAALRARLLARVPEDPAARDAEQQARWLLAYLLDFHRREDKSGWWEYFRLRDLPEDELVDEPRAVAGLVFVERVEQVRHKTTGRSTGSVVDRYRYPAQEIEIRRGDELKLQDERKLGDVVAHDRVARTLDLKKSRAVADVHPSAAFAHKYINVAVLEDAIDAIGEAVAASGGVLTSAGHPDRLARGLLLAEPPRLRSGALAPQPGETTVDFATRVADALDETVLAIQGPPGAGKTYCGGAMIAALVKRGKRIGVTATSHKVIRNLLDAVQKAADREGFGIALGHKIDAKDDGRGETRIAELDDNAQALAALQNGTVDVLGGTAWLWARPELAGAVDVLFVDEAGQMALANVVALSRAAGSIVLLGDPQQLDQPQKGTHPDGISVSALEHLLGSHQTLPADRGIFLATTWRLAPGLCAYTSEAFYEGRLTSKPGLERQVLAGTDGLDGSGLWTLDVEHVGNGNASMEEVDAVEGLIARLTGSGARWIDEQGTPRPMTTADVLVVAPYNAQVSRLAERLEPLGVRVGTVDKFQGQEAPVVLYSMATSQPADAPRGMEFLYSLNRLNVATSRARCAVIVVANPRLFEPECRTPRQMKLANVLCRYRELARAVPRGSSAEDAPNVDTLASVR